MWYDLSLKIRYIPQQEGLMRLLAGGHREHHKHRKNSSRQASLASVPATSSKESYKVLAALVGPAGLIRALNCTFFTRFSMNEMTGYSPVFQASDATCSHHTEGHGTRWCYSSRYRGGQKYRSNLPKNRFASRIPPPFSLKQVWRFIIGVQNRYVSLSHYYIRVRMPWWYSRIWRPCCLLNSARDPPFLRESSPTSSVDSWDTFCADFGWCGDYVCSISPAWLSHCFCENFKSVYT